MSDSDLVDLLSPVSNPFDDEELYYALTNVRSHATSVSELFANGVGPGLLAVLEDDARVIVSFVVLEAMVGEGSDGHPALYRMVFEGHGVSGSLRELRHTYWGDDGYLHFPPSKLISDAFAKLEEWFDV